LITRLRLHNFKRFESLDLRFARLTLLTGLNGSGKSSVIQAMLLARAAALSEDPLVSLSREADGLTLGTATDVLNHNADTQSIVIELVDRRTLTWVFDAGEFPDSTFLQLQQRPESVPKDICELNYVGAERSGPRLTAPVASSDERPSWVGTDGRFVASVLASADRREIDPALRNSRASSTLLPSQVEAWMSWILGAVQVQASFVPRTDVATLLVRHGNTEEWLLPTNTGFGVSYVLPVVVAALLSGKGSVLVVDSPEAHLHPSAQSALGQFLCVVASAGVQVVVETHSDHVLNGVRLGVFDTSLTHKDVIFHFFGPDDPATIEMSADSGIERWPEGFFDQSRRDLAKLVKRKSDR